MQEYKIKIEYDKTQETKSNNPIDIERQTEERHASPETIKQKTRSNDMMRTLQTTAALYGFSRQAVQMGVTYQATTFNIQGDSLRAERMQTKFSNVSNNIGLGLGIGISLMTGNPVAIGLTAYALAQRAFNLANETRQYQAQLSLERYQAQYYQNRLVQDISGVR